MMMMNQIWQDEPIMGRGIFHSWRPTTNRVGQIYLFH